MTNPIIIEKVMFQNFISVGNAPVEISFKAPRTLLYGTNGQGKSTVMDAISWGLYGKSFRGVESQDKLINHTISKQALVEVHLRTRGANYMIRRGLKPSILEIYKNNILVPIPDKRVDYQNAFTNNVMGIDHHTFCRTVMLGYANYKPFMEMTAPERRKFIEDVLDLKVFPTMLEKCKEKLKAVEADINQIDYDIRAAERELELVKEHNEKAVADVEGLIAEKLEKIKEYQRKNVDLGQQKLKIESAITKLQKELKAKDAIYQEINKLLREQTTLERDVDDFSKKLSFYEKNEKCPTCKQQITTTFKKHSCDELGSSVKEKKARISEIKKREKELKAQLAEFEEKETQLSRLTQANTKATTQITQNNEFIRTIGRERDKLQEKTKDIKDTSEIEKRIKNLRRLHRARYEVRALYDTAKAIFSDSGAKATILKQYLPILNATINDYLQKLNFFARFEIDENFNETITMGAEDVTYKCFSQGEQMRIDLAMLLAWRALAKTRHSTAVNLLVMDEVLDSSLDFEGIEMLLDILSKEKTHKSDNILVITHKSEIIQSNYFDQVIQVKKRRGFTEFKLDKKLEVV